MRLPQYPLIIAHRGYSSRYPENTLPAFTAALAAGAHGIELDIAISRDNQAMVIHDDTLERTTNGKGEVRRFNATELRELDAGSWFSAEFKGARVPLLSEIFDSFGNKTLINVEIKPHSAADVAMDPESLIKNLVELVTDYGLKESVFFSSFDHRFAPLLHQMNMSFGFLYSALPDPKTIQAGRNLLVHPAANKLTAEWMSEMRERKKIIFPWTVNEPAQARQLLQWGARGIFTDRPAEMLAALGIHSKGPIKS